MKRSLLSSSLVWTTLTLTTAGLLQATPPMTAAEQLHALFAEEWAYRLTEDPLLATAVGVHEHDDRLPSVTVADEARRAAVWRAFLDRLQAIDRAALGAEDDISYQVLARELRERLEDFELGAWRLPITAEAGFHTDIAHLPRQMPFMTAADYARYLARLRALPVYFDQYVELLRDGIAHGVTQPRVVLTGYEQTIASHVVDDPAASVFYAPFASFPTTVAAPAQERLRQEGKAAVQDAVVPSYRRFLRFMLDEYLPAARTTLGASELPDGRAFYAQRIRHYTTLDVTAEEVHALGRREVARIRAEMQGVIEQVDFASTGDAEETFASFLAFLRRDPRFYAATPEELLKEASYIAKRMDGKLPALFKTLPRQPYGVAPVPEHIAPKYTAGRYVGAAADSTEAGTYWVNTWALASRPLYALPALTLHEAVPGHHLQIARAQELAELPPLRRFSYISAFGEGWGLYAEWLGVEAGIYDDPYAEFGRLTYEMWRACRLVVDTGIHAMGWTRQQAIDYLAGHTALSLHEVTTEIDRYISWPGQALAYKMGELEIRRLRQEAEAALGERFDVRDFHDAVIGHGSLPLPVLRSVIERYVREQAREQTVE